ncbi:hypothetical protein ACF0H5_020072 [Mactra antiquata]
MDDKQVLQSTQQVSTGRQLSCSDGGPHLNVQPFSSTPAKNMILSNCPPVNHHMCGADYQNTHGSSNTIHSHSQEQQRLNESVGHNIGDVFQNMYDSNQGFNFSQSNCEDLIMHPSLRQQPKSSPSGKSTQWYEQDIPKAKNESGQTKSIPKEKKSITTKTFAKGMMDVSLLSSNATQLRTVLTNNEHDFYKLLLWLITLSIILQVLSSVLLLMSDYFKTDVKEKDEANQGKRKFLNFLSLAMVTVVTSLNILISVFSSPTSHVSVSHTPPSTPTGRMNVPQFSESSLHGSRSEL